MSACVDLLARRKYTGEYILYNFISSKKQERKEREKHKSCMYMYIENHYGRRCATQLMLITSICWK